MITVAGVDGCPGGWIAVLWGEELSHHLCRDFSEVLSLPAEVIAVDMPIGLPEKSGRRAEQQARKVLGTRQSSVFAIPSRAAVACSDYAQACAVNLLNSDPPRKIAKQSFHLFPKIRQIDAVIAPALQSRVHEVHPEVAFWVMNGMRPLNLAKKIRQENHKPGLELRQQLLADNGFPVHVLPPTAYRKFEVGDDDLIDACACAWSARRILECKHIAFPEDPEQDARGLVMQIKA